MVTWFVNGMEIKPSPHYEMLYEDGKSVLLIIEVGPEDTGEYTMKATSDEFGEIVSSTTLYVQGNGKGHLCFSYLVRKMFSSIFFSQVPQEAWCIDSIVAHSWHRICLYVHLLSNLKKRVSITFLKQILLFSKFNSQCFCFQDKFFISNCYYINAIYIHVYL